MDRGTGARKPFKHGGPKVIFAIDDAVFDELRPSLLETIGALPGLEAEIVRSSTLADPNTEADFCFGAPPASRPGFTSLCVTHAGTLFEQEDSTGAIYRGGKEVWPEAPVAFGAPKLVAHGALYLRHDGALLFQSLPDRTIRVTGIPFITGLFATPRIRAPLFPIDTDWFKLAGQLLGPEMR